MENVSQIFHKLIANALNGLSVAVMTVATNSVLMNVRNMANVFNLMAYANVIPTIMEKIALCLL